MNSSSTHWMFQLKLDPLTGNSEWVVIEEEEDELQEDSPKPLLATTFYLGMLNDSLRNRAYREAIDKRVTKPCHVLDIGAGTGLLSLMAARAMGPGKSTSCSSSRGTVTACESYLPMLKLMRKVLRTNDMEGEICVINKRSDELIAGVDFTSQADILVDLLIAEPFYCGNDNGLPWQNLRFWKEWTMLDSVLSEDVVIMPRKGILKDLWTSRRCLKEIKGFDHSVVNSTLGACGDSPSTQETP